MKNHSKLFFFHAITLFKDWRSLWLKSTFGWNLLIFHSSCVPMQDSRFTMQDSGKLLWGAGQDSKLHSSRFKVKFDKPWAQAFLNDPRAILLKIPEPWALRGVRHRSKDKHGLYGWMLIFGPKKFSHIPRWQHGLMLYLTQPWADQWSSQFNQLKDLAIESLNPNEMLNSNNHLWAFHGWTHGLRGGWREFAMAGLLSQW